METVADFILAFNAQFGLWSTERPRTRVSNSEIRRWFANGAIYCGGVVAMPETLFDPCHDSIVLFPKGKRRTTLW